MFKSVDPHPNFPKLEEEILAFWEKEKIFEKSLEKNSPHGGSSREFVFYDGPPFATGLPHYGHILASTIKDVIPRYQTMRGRFVPRRWGWDCHGLPIEEIVERELKISGKKDIEEKIGIKKFNETCRSMVLMYVKEWGKMVRRIARWTEFENSYKTMNRDYIESVWWGFKEIYKKGLVYEGRKVLLYCPRCETPISNFEVAMDNSYETITEEAVIVKFKVKSDLSRPPATLPRPGEGLGERSNTYLLSWTTTPWTLPGNVALAVGKDIEYVMVKSTPTLSPPHQGGDEEGDEYYIVAKDRASAVIPAKAGIQGMDPRVKPEDDRVIKGKDLVGLRYEPLFPLTPPSPARGEGGRRPGEGNWDKAYKIYPADFVNTEEGTGIVHTAVVYGEEDYELGQKVGLPVVPLLDEKGRFNGDAPKFIQGMYLKDAEKPIKEDLEKRGLLFERKMHTHSYPHCWRCGTPLFYNAIPAWFINIQKIKQKLLASNKKEINWFPEHLKLGRYAKSVEQAPDWNISRNRYWGNPIPVWKCQACDKVTVIGSFKELSDKALNSKFQIPNSKIDLHRPYIDEVILKCEHCGGQARRITEIFDSWVEAASMPFASVHYPFSGGKFPFPADFVTEYIAQTRAWFYVMHVVSLILFGKAPFRNVLTTGTILSEKGEKLSKSRRNFPDPWEVIDKYGVDSLRFYLMNSVVMQADNLFFNERDLANIYRKVVLILWNVYLYFVQYNPNLRINPNATNKKILDEWISARLQELINSVTKYLDGCDTVKATRELQMFIDDLSTWYLRRSRGRSDEAFFATLRQVLIELSKVIAPVMPYLSEAIYQNLKGSNGGKGSKGGVSVHLADWPGARKLTKSQIELLAQMREIRKIVEEVHAQRAKAGVKLRQKLGKLIIPRDLSPRLSPRQGRGAFLSRPPLERGGKKGEVEFELLELLKSELNVSAIVFGDKLELDITITPDLKIEGLARELERQIQAFRKELGLRIGEMVDLFYETDSDIIKKAMKIVDRKKTYLRNIEYGILNMEGKEMEVEGEKVRINLKTPNPNFQ